MENEKKTRNADLEQIINRLIIYCKKNPYIWINRRKANEIISGLSSKELKERKYKELEQARKDYRYIVTRKKENKLSIEQEKRLKRSNVGGIFGKTKIQKDLDYEAYETSKKYGIDVELLKNIIHKYGDLDNFREKYIEYFIKKGNVQDKLKIEKIIEKLDGKLICYFDLSNIKLINLEDSYKELNDIEKYEIFLDANQIKEKTEERIKLLTKRNEEIFRLYYGLGDGEKYKLQLIADKYNISRERVRQILLKANTLYNSFNPIKNEIDKVEDFEIREKIIRLFFDNHDVFINGIEQNIEPKIYKKIVEISGIERLKIEDIEKPKIDIKSLLLKLQNIKNTIKEVVKNNFESGNNKEIKDLQVVLEKVEDIYISVNYILVDKGEFVDQTLEIDCFVDAIKDLENYVIPINTLGLQRRTCNVLKRNGINLVGQITSKSSKELEKMKSLGECVLNDIYMNLYDSGFKLLGESSDLNSECFFVIQQLQREYEKLNLLEQECDRKLEIAEKIIEQIKSEDEKRNNKVDELLREIKVDGIDKNRKIELLNDIKMVLDEEKDVNRYNNENIESKTQKLIELKEEIKIKKDNIKNRIDKLEIKSIDENDR